MRYHNITTEDMLNGDGLRVVLWVAGCNHACTGCQNPLTWDYNSGVLFDKEAREELFEELKKDYISGITFSGGDPFDKRNINEVTKLIHDIKTDFPTKTVWVYTGHSYEYLYDDCYHALVNVDVLVDGKFVQELADINYHWAGSTNQRIINIQESLKQDKVVLWES